MKKFLSVILVLVAVVYFAGSGCAKKQQVSEEMQEPMSMEALGALETKAQVAPETNAAVVQNTAITPAKLESLPPGGPYKPTVSEIQAALKNAGYYTGVIDGKIGPLTRRATEDFQKASGLAIDGKVGPKTWSILSAYLKPVVEPTAKKKL